MFYLAHVGRASIGAAAMRGGVKIMVRTDSKSPFFINVAWICVDLREAITYSQMIQNRLDVEEICIAYNPQITPETTMHI